MKSIFRPYEIPTVSVSRRNDILIGSFQAMGSPCEILLETQDAALGRKLIQEGVEEARRIEYKFSRYRSDNIVHEINNSEGREVNVDEETSRLLDYANRCYQLSDGLFDVTSGVLRKIWKFNGTNAIPEESEIERYRSLVGWNKVMWQSPSIRIQTGMEIDLGGIGKEYAVDRVVELLYRQSKIALLVNFGGDIAVAGHKKNGTPWAVGIENPTTENTSIQTIPLETGALATSGDSKKFIVSGNRRLGHILDPRSGHPVEQAPRSVTVMASTCSEAGFLSTFGILSGPKAQAVLNEVGAPHWCY